MIDTELNAVRLDPGSKLRRDFRKPIPPDQIGNYRNRRLGQYDDTTIFYDVFLSDDCRSVTAIGPVLLNLKNILLPATLTINNCSSLFKIKTDYKKMLILSAKLPKKLPDKFPVVAKVSFANGISKTIHLHAPTPLYGDTLVTLQKDNKIEWLMDWVAYYRDQFAIEHVVIYDNNSTKQKQLIVELEDKAKIIPWPFPYGVMYKSTNKFAQIGAFNHFKLRYARNSRIYCFDIDELLVCKTEKAKRTIRSAKKIRFIGFPVPHYLREQENYSFADFPRRSAQPQDRAYKYIAHSDLAGVMNVHYFRMASNFLNWLLPKSFSRGPILSVKDAYFLHYRGITGKQGMLYHRRVGDCDRETENLVEDHSIIKAFASLYGWRHRY